MITAVVGMRTVANVIKIADAIRRRDERIEGLWKAYLVARDQAEHSRDVRDGIAAGKAWAAFLDQFRAVSA